MCGIIGYFGLKDPKRVILDGLKNLEYRGYDSAGVAILHQGKFKRVRAEGKLKELEQKLATEEFDGRLGIGHTRWATHGPPSERNAHPHCVEGVSLIHNGIIENYLELRAELKKEGAQFSSDTDSELVAHLIAAEVRVTHDLFSAVLRIIPKLEGAYSIVVVWEDQPDVLVAFKKGPPLVAAKSEDSVIVASDIQPLMSFTSDVFFLNDDEVFVSRGGEIELFDKSGKVIHRRTTSIRWTPELIEKKGYAHFMLKEIYEQPRAVASALRPHLDLENFTVKMQPLGFLAKDYSQLETLDKKEDEIATWSQLSKVNRLVIIACGTSFYASMYAKYLIERLAHLPVEVDIASEYRYRDALFPPGTMALVISQSGETADTLAALRKLKDLGATTLSLCNVRCSSIDREAHGHLYMNVGSEIGVASTKAFSGTLAVLNILALQLAKIRGTISAEQERAGVMELLALPSLLETVLVHDSFFAEAAQTLKSYRGFLYMGRGINYPLALEGALKMKELAYMHAEGYAAGEMKHGPLALIDKNMAVVMVVPKDDLFDKTVSNLQEARARGGQIISIGTGEDPKLSEMSLHYLALPEASWNISPILALIPLQLLSYHVATALGHDVDQPRNLAKSVTVE